MCLRVDDTARKGDGGKIPRQSEPAEGAGAGRRHGGMDGWTAEGHVLMSSSRQGGRRLEGGLEGLISKTAVCGGEGRESRALSHGSSHPLTSVTPAASVALRAVAV